MATGKSKSKQRRSDSKSSGSSSMNSKERKQANGVSRAYTTTGGDKIQVLKNGTKITNGVESGKVATPAGTRMVMGNSGSSRLVKVGSGADAKYDEKGNYKKATYASPFKNTIQTTTGIRNRDTSTQNKYNEMMTNRMGGTTPATPVPTVTTTNTQSTRTGNGQPVPTDIQGASVNSYKDNGDGTTTNYLSDGKTSTVRYVKNADGSMTPVEVGSGEGSSAILDAERDFTTRTRQQLADLDTERAMFDKKIDRLIASNNSLFKNSINSIKSTFDVRSDSLRENYARLGASREKAGYQTDSFRYTPTHAEGLITNDENNMIMELADLDAQEQSLILTATTAKEQKNWDALETQMKMYDAISEKKSTLVGSLLTAAQEQNRRIEAEAKIEREIAEAVDKNERENKELQSGDKAMKRAENVAPVIAKAIAKMSASEAEAYVAKKAGELGVDAEILQSAVIDRGRIDDEYARSLIPKPKAGTKLTEGEKKTNAYSQLEQIMSSGINPQGNGSMAYSDPNGFFTPQGFSTLISLARNSGISKSDFLSEYGSYLDPDNLKQYKLTGKDIADLEG